MLNLSNKVLTFLSYVVYKQQLWVGDESIEWWFPQCIEQITLGHGRKIIKIISYSLIFLYYTWHTIQQFTNVK